MLTTVAGFFLHRKITVMQLLILLLSFSFMDKPPGLTVIDMNFVQPVSYATDFAVDGYFKRKFPIHSDDIMSIVAATEKAAKLIDSRRAFTIDTLLASRSTFIIYTNNDESKTITVRLITALEDNLSFAFELVRKEGDRRKAQRKLVDFAAYLLK